MKAALLMIPMLVVASMMPAFVSVQGEQIVSLKWIIPPEQERGLFNVSYTASENYTIIGRTNGTDVEVSVNSYDNSGTLLNRRYFSCGNLTAYTYNINPIETHFDLLGRNNDNSTIELYLNVYDAALENLYNITFVINNTIVVLNVTAIEYIYVNTTTYINTTIYENVTITEYINDTIIEVVTITKIIKEYEDRYFVTPEVAVLIAIAAICMIVIYFHSERERAKRRKRILWLGPEVRK